MIASPSSYHHGDGSGSNTDSSSKAPVTFLNLHITRYLSSKQPVLVVVPTGSVSALVPGEEPSFQNLQSAPIIWSSWLIIYRKGHPGRF